jgi:signal transduction histidine kinase
MTAPATGRVDASELRTVPLFAHLTQQQVEWVAGRLEVSDLTPGDVLFREGEKPKGLFVLFSGELTLTRNVGGREEVLTRHSVAGCPDPDKPVAANSFTGEVQLLTGDTYIATATACSPGRVGLLDPPAFDEMMACCPEVARIMLPVLAWRIRAEEAQARERGTLTALGTMAAGLAHELNNPAAAARRASGELRNAIGSLSQVAAQWGEGGSTADIRSMLPAGTKAPSGGMASAEREDEIDDWFDDHDYEPAADDTGLLADSGADAAWLDSLLARVGEATFPLAIRYACAMLAMDALVGDVTDSVSRISALVDDVRAYTQLDRAPVLEVDLNAGIESTLRLLSSKLDGIKVERNYAPDLPRPVARGAELNQVWTNLIDNAIDAMGGPGTLAVSTHQDGNAIAVEITDSGPGIPEEIRSRLFEPFFTTKDIGKGTGLGLHIVYRIVTERHGGSIEVYSVPGRTRFIVHIPLAPPGG